MSDAACITQCWASLYTVFLFYTPPENTLTSHHRYLRVLHRATGPTPSQMDRIGLQSVWWRQIWQQGCRRLEIKSIRMSVRRSGGHFSLMWISHGRLRSQDRCQLRCSHGKLSALCLHTHTHKLWSTQIFWVMTIMKKLFAWDWKSGRFSVNLSRSLILSSSTCWNDESIVDNY